jgi:hypothetical protein
MKQRDEYIVDLKVHNPRAVNLVCDATFYGKKIFIQTPYCLYD